jgi:hypothetical protein
MHGTINVNSEYVSRNTVLFIIYYILLYLLCNPNLLWVVPSFNSHYLWSRRTEIILENANDRKVPAVNDAYHSARCKLFSLLMKGSLTTIIIARDQLIASLWPFDLSTKGRAEFTQYAWCYEQSDGLGEERNGNSYLNSLRTLMVVRCLPNGPRQGFPDYEVGNMQGSEVSCLLGTH